MTKPIVARLPDGTEYGFVDSETALSLHPEAVIVRHQDGSLLPEMEEAATKPIEKLTRDELNALALAAGVDSPDKLGTKDDVIEAYHAAQAGS